MIPAVVALLAVTLLSAGIGYALVGVIRRQAEQIISLSILASDRSPAEQSALVRAARPDDRPPKDLEGRVNAALEAAQPHAGSLPYGM